MSLFHSDAATLRAEAAFAAHAALLLHQCEDRRLFTNPYWTAARIDAFEQFAVALAEMEAAHG